MRQVRPNRVIIINSYSRDMSEVDIESKTHSSVFYSK
jgi:hypothetical protein